MTDFARDHPAVYEQSFKSAPPVPITEEMLLCTIRSVQATSGCRSSHGTANGALRASAAKKARAGAPALANGGERERMQFFFQEAMRAMASPHQWRRGMLGDAGPHAGASPPGPPNPQGMLCLFPSMCL